MEVHWRIIANLGFKFLSHFTVLLAVLLAGGLSCAMLASARLSCSLNNRYFYENDRSEPFFPRFLNRDNAMTTKFMAKLNTCVHLAQCGVGHSKTDSNRHSYSKIFNEWQYFTYILGKFD